MKITIFGATGGIGRQLLDQALAAGLEPAVASAILAAIGPRSRVDVGVTARGTGVIIQTMRAVDARRLVVVSAAPISTTPSPGRPNPPKHDPGEGFGCDTCSPRESRSCCGRTADEANLRRGLTISRADVAHFMLDAVSRPETFKRAVGIAY